MAAVLTKENRKEYKNEINVHKCNLTAATNCPHYITVIMVVMMIIIVISSSSTTLNPQG